MARSRETRQTHFFERQGVGADNGFVLQRPSRRVAPHEGDLELPVPDADFIKYKKGNRDRYLKSGRRDARLLRRALTEAGVDQHRGPGRVLDFGCANARVLRWFSDWAACDEIWGVDLSSDMIYWCQENLSPPFHFGVCTTAPNLFFEDRFFQLIFCFSVFTHVDDLYLSWICELRRVLDQNGFLYITFFDENTAKLQAETNAASFDLRSRSEAYQKFVETNADFCASGRDWQSLISFRREYFLEHLKNYFDVIAIIEKAMALSQTGVLLKKR